MTALALGVCVALVATGLLVCIASLRPVSPSLEESSDDSAVRDRQSFGAEVARLINLKPTEERRNELWLVDRQFSIFVYERTLASIGGAICAFFLSVLLGWSTLMTLLVVASFGTAGWFLPVMILHQHVENRRAEIRSALGVFIGLIAASVSGGNPLSQAASESAEQGQGWAWDRFREITTRSGAGGTELPEELADLGDLCGVDEMKNLATAMGLTHREGGIIKDTLSVQSDSINEALANRAEVEAEKETTRMIIPSSMVFIAFVVFMMFAVLGQLGTALL